MKRVKKILLVIIFIMVMAIFTLICCSLNYEEVYETDDGWLIAHNKLTGKCFVGECEWNGDRRSMEMTVPDEHRGVPVTQLGGYTGGPGRKGPLDFCVFLNDKFLKEKDEWSIMEDDGALTDNEYETLTFTIHIGENLQSIERILGPYYYLKGEDIVYRIDYYFIVSKKNETFYSKDGNLYYKEDDTPVLPVN